MKAKITKAFKFAREGNFVVDVAVGEIVEGRCAEVALQEKWGEPFKEAPPTPAPAPEKPAEKPAEKADPAPAKDAKKGR